LSRWLRVGLLVLGLAALAIASMPTANASGRLEQIKQRGYLVCGVAPGVVGFAAVDAKGRYSGFDIDICRAVSAAIFASADQVRFVDSSSVDGFMASPEIDLVVRRLTWTLTREASNTLMFGPIVFYDGEGFLVPAASPISSGRDLDGKRVCVDAGEDWAGALARYAHANRLVVEIVVVANRGDGEKQFFNGKCDAYAADKSMLGAIRADASVPGNYRILPDQFTKEPLAPLLRQGDDQFFQIVRWTIFVLIDAEELEVTSRNVGALRSSDDPEIRALVGNGVAIGRTLGLSKDWAFDIIADVGNYREVYARNLGVGSPIKLNRGMNDLWTRGGLLYAPPVR